MAAPEVRPVALAFKAEHPGAGLPAIADLTTDGAAGCVMATLGGDERAGRRDEVPALVARTPAAIGADVEAAPVVHDGDRRRRRLGVRTRREVSRRRGRRECNESNRTQAEPSSWVYLQLLSASVGPEAFSK